jgi:spore coat protein U-like protein
MPVIGPRAPVAVVVAILLCGVSTAHAGADCSITAVNLNFGAYDPLLSLPDDSAGAITVTCNYIPPGATTVNYTVALSNGLNATSASTRNMAAGTERLGYNVFSDPARTATWGNGTGGSVLVSGSTTVGPGVGNSTRKITHSVYGRLPALQDAVPGSYLDTLLLTLIY